MIKNKREEGKEGEDLAVEHLTLSGYEIMHRNYTFGKGEIDIIAKDPENGFVVFVEVKMRKNLEFGEPEYAITKNKIAQVRKIALGYLYENELAELECRFDVIAILKLEGKPLLLNHYKDAF